MYPITITLHNEAQFLAASRALNALDNPQPAVNPPPVETKKLTVEEEAKKPASAPEVKSADTQATAPEDAAPTPKADTSAPAKTVDDAKALTMKIVSDKGRDAAVALLKKYDVPVAAKLPADKIAAFCADAEEVLAS